MSIESLKSLRLQGVGKYIHNIVMFLTYPFRHAFKFFGLLFVLIVILAAIPMSQGVSYKHIIDWYLLRYNQIETKVNFRKRDKQEAVERQVKKEFRKEFKFKETAAPDRRNISIDLKQKMEGNVNSSKAVTENKEVKRKTFNIKKTPFRHTNVKNTWNKKTEEKPFFAEEKTSNTNINEQNMASTQPLQIKADPIANNDEVVVPMPDIKNKLSYRKIEGLPLIYTDNPEHIEGLALIFGANDLSVDDKYIILYGIYTDALRFNIEKATEYLQELADKKHIECEIVAYTHQNYPTAICFIDGKSINQHLVDAGFADNVAL